jgi:hypothetical protein
MPATDRSRYLAPYSANHNRVRKTRGPASAQLCEGGCQGRAYDWAYLHDTDPAEPASYVPLCRRCHNQYDKDAERAGMARRAHNPTWLAYKKRAPRDAKGRYA